MSEYLYYDFRAIDRPLNEKQMNELRALSRRAEITTTSFTNTYHWGDFRGNPATLMDRYFDAFVYVANWGTHWLMFRVPMGFLDAKVASMNCDGETISVRAWKDHVVVEFSSESHDDNGWTEGEHWRMPSLISLRADVVSGDLRALYLGWLASLPLQDMDADDEEADDLRLEPPVPPGLAKRSAPSKALAEFLRGEETLLEATAAGVAGDAGRPRSRIEPR